MRVLVLYASDLRPQSRIAPGGITSNLRGYLGGLPAEWDLVVWGAAERGSGMVDKLQTLELRRREVFLRPIVEARPAGGRRVPLAVEYCAALAARAWRRQLTKHRWDVIIAHRAEYLAAIASSRAFARLPPCIAMIHGSSAFSFQGLGTTRGYAYLLSEAVAVQHAEAVALVSGSALPYYRSRYPRRADRFHWIPNGVDLTRFAGPVDPDWRRQHGFSDQDRLLVYHGRYDREKGVQRMLDALAILREDKAPWHLVCAGVGPLQPLLARAAEGWAKGHVHDVGYLDEKEIVSLLKSGDIGLLCSDFEGLSNSLLEALAAGLPVVATDAGDNSLVLNELAPELICDRTPQAIANTVRWAWERRRELAMRAPSVAERYSLEARISRIKSLIASVARNGAVS